MKASAKRCSALLRRGVRCPDEGVVQEGVRWFCKVCMAERLGREKARKK